MMAASLKFATFGLIIQTVLAWEKHLNFRTCYIGINYVNEDKRYKVEWSGDPVSVCDLTFNGFNSDVPLNEYKVCIRATTWDIQTDGVVMKYKSGVGVLSTWQKKEYDKYSTWDTPTTEWCSDSEEYVDIELKAPSYTNDRIVLEVRAEMTFNYNKVIGWAVGGAVGGVALIVAVCVIVIVIFCRRRKGRAGQVIANQNTNAFQLQTVTQQSTGMYGYNTAPPAPPGYSQFAPQKGV